MVQKCFCDHVFLDQSDLGNPNHQFLVYTFRGMGVCVRACVSPQSFFSLRPMEAYCVDCFASHSYPSYLICLRDSSMLVNKELALFFFLNEWLFIVWMNYLFSKVTV